MEDVKPKKDLLLWSGGLDSTSIFFKYFLKRNPIDLVYFDLQNNHRKSRAELTARDRIKQILKFNYPDASMYLSSITDRVYEINEIHPVRNGAVSYWQPFIWLTSLIQIINTDVEYQNVILGYIQKDDFWHIRREFEDAYKNLQYVVSPHDGIKWPTLSYPFEWKSKQDLVNELSEHKVGRLILDQIWTCEMPRDEEFELLSCGLCLPCKKLKELRTAVAISELYLEKMKDEVIDLGQTQEGIQVLG